MFQPDVAWLVGMGGVDVSLSVSPVAAMAVYLVGSFASGRNRASHGSVLLELRKLRKE